MNILIKRLRRKTRWLFSRGYLDPKAAFFQSLFPKKVAIERIARGFRFTEGPIWFSQGPYLLFSDIPANRILKFTPNGQVSTFRHPSSHSNGLTQDLQGRLITCEHGTHRVTRTEWDGSITTLAHTYRGRKLNCPNDVVVKSDGSIYFTDPYGIEPPQQEQPIQGVYRLSPDGNHLAVVAVDFERPNGLAFSPDETKLYIDDSSLRRHIRVFDVQPDGMLANGGVFQDMNIHQSGPPDGMKVDTEGRVFCTGPGGVWVIDPTGTHLGTIVLPEQPSNCAWGADDLRSLYMTARTSVYRIRVNTPGIRCGARA